MRQHPVVTGLVSVQQGQQLLQAGTQSGTTPGGEGTELTACDASLLLSSLPTSAALPRLQRPALTVT